MEVVGVLMRCRGRSAELLDRDTLRHWLNGYTTALALHLHNEHEVPRNVLMRGLRDDERRVSLRLNADLPKLPAGLDRTLADDPSRYLGRILLLHVRVPQFSPEAERLLLDLNVPNRPYPEVSSDLSEIVAEETRYSDLTDSSVRGALNRLTGRPVDEPLAPDEASGLDFQNLYRQGRVAGIDGTRFNVEGQRISVCVLVAGYPERLVAAYPSEETSMAAEQLVRQAVMLGEEFDILVHDGLATYLNSSFGIFLRNLGIEPYLAENPAQNPVERVNRRLKDCMPNELRLEDFANDLAQAVAMVQDSQRRAA